MLNKMASWNVIVCGDLKSPVGLFIPDPTKWTVADLKKELIKKITLSESDLVLYCDHNKIPDGKPLKECNGMMNGVALLLCIKPILINVYCPVLDVTLEIKISRDKYAKCTVSTLVSMISSRLGISHCQDDVLAMQGDILKNLSLPLSSLPDITDTLLTYTIMDQFQYTEAVSGQVENISLPFRTEESFALNHCFCIDTSKTNLSTTTLQYSNFILQQQDGSKMELHLKFAQNLPIFTLREEIRNVLSIPTQLQKLYIGDGIVLKDWDDDGKVMLVAHYPLYNNVTINVVQLTEGIHINLLLPSFPLPNFPRHKTVPLSTPRYNDLKISTRRIFVTNFMSKPSAPNYINIHDPRMFSGKLLFSVMRNCARGKWDEEFVVYLDESIEPSMCFSSTTDKLLSSFKWITDGCTLTVTKPTLKTSK